MIRIELELTDREAAAIFRSQGLSSGHGVKVSADLQKANERLMAAVAQAAPQGRRRRTPAGVASGDAAATGDLG